MNFEKKKEINRIFKYSSVHNKSPQELRLEWTSLQIPKSRPKYTNIRK